MASNSRDAAPNQPVPCNHPLGFSPTCEACVWRYQWQRMLFGPSFRLWEAART